MSHAANITLMDLFLEECTQEWRCPYCGGNVKEEWPFCCKENHGEEMLCAPNGEMIGDDDSALKEAFTAWLSKRGEP